MVQKSSNLSMEIVLNLLEKGQNHVRGIAKDLGESHTTILRNTAGLVKGNVLDCKVDGKNKTFSLKKTLNAMNCVYMAEHYKTGAVLIRYPELGPIIKDVFKLTDSKLIILFGSYSKFSPKKESDIDIFIETTNRKTPEKISQIDSRLSVKIGYFDLKNNLVKEIIKNHAILRGVEEFYAKTGFFN